MSRRGRIWELLVKEAGEESNGQVSVSVACRTALRALAVDGATVSAIVDGDVHASVYSTSEAGRRLEDLQSSLGEGPSMQSYFDGAPVLVSDLGAAAARWPVFGSATAEMGVRALFAFPLLSGMLSIGVFEVHRSRSEALTPEEISDALILADIISLLLLAPNGQGDQESLENGITSEHQVLIYQATGMLSVQLGITLTDAHARIRGRAFADGESVSAVAREVVHRRLRLDEDGSIG